MAAKTFEVQVQDDHLQRISQTRKPVLAVAELIWNAVDADADRIDITLVDDHLGALRAVEVADNGHGIPYSEAEALFSKLGGSWKPERRFSREKRRLLHGKEGRGRFRAFALGRVIDWDVRYSTADELRQYRVSMVKDWPRRVQLSDDEPVRYGSETGIIVRVSELVRDFRSLRSEEAPADLALIFALYLRQYPTIGITYNGTRINPTAAEDVTASYDLSPIATSDEETFPVSLEIVEWRIRTERRLYFCDADGFPLDETVPGVPAPGFDFTAYLKSDYFAKLVANNLIDLATMDPAVDRTLSAARALTGR